MRISDWSSDVCSSDLSAQRAGAAPQARCLHGCHRSHSRGGWLGAAQTAAHGQTDLRAVARRAWLRGRLYHRQGLRARAAAAQPRGLRAAGPRSRPCAGGFRRGDRKSVVEGKRVSERVDSGGRRIIKKKTEGMNKSERKKTQK